jgi:hypothetical protein
MLTPSLVFAYWMRGSIVRPFYAIGWAAARPPLTAASGHAIVGV